MCDSTSAHRRSGKDDPLFVTAIQAVRSNNKASIAFVQRYFRIGYNRAAYLIEAMEGVVISHPTSDGMRTVFTIDKLTKDG